MRFKCGAETPGDLDKSPLERTLIKNVSINECSKMCLCACTRLYTFAKVIYESITDGLLISENMHTQVLVTIFFTYMDSAYPAVGLQYLIIQMID